MTSDFELRVHYKLSTADSTYYDFITYVCSSASEIPSDICEKTVEEARNLMNVETKTVEIELIEYRTR